MNNDHLFEFKGLSHRYNGSNRKSLDDIDIKIAKGKKTVLLGANGAGKSTLFYHLNGVLKPRSGEVLYNGSPIVYNRKGLMALRSEVSVVLQNPDDMIFSATVEEDVAFGPLNLRLPMEEVKSRVDHALDVMGLDEMRKKPAQQLSYGQRKRVALAGALAMNPKVLVLDEPTAGLDPQMSNEVMELADQLHHQGTTIIIATHDIDLIYPWAEEVHVLRGGQLIYSGNSEEFYKDPVEVRLAGLMEPSIYCINRNLSIINKLSEYPHPRTKTQLISKMTERTNGIGKLIIREINDGLSSDELEKVANGRKLSLGAYGAKARKAAYDGNLHVDFYFDALECCLMQTLLGNDTIICCEPCLTELIMENVTIMKYFGTDIRTSVHKG